MKPKKLFIAAAILGMLACIGAGSVCAAAQTQPIGGACLSVTGTASVEAAADACIFSGCVEAVGNDMRAAEEACAAMLQSVKDIFAAYGSLREESSSAYPSCNGGYTATKYLSFTTDKVDKAAEIRAALAKTGVTCLDGVGRITIDGEDYLLREGQSIVMPAGHPHAVYGQEAFKMLLVVVF